MNFSTIFENFKILSAGTDAFKQLKNNCESALQKNTISLEHSSLFLIYGFAKNYVLLYEDEAVESEFASSAKEQLLSYMQILNNALQSNQSHIILEVQNKISYQYMQSSRIF